DGAVRAAGPHALLWDGRDDTGRPAASGAYLVRLRAGGRVDAGKLTLVR
nr:hypothetical protein [bacterium]